MKKITLIICFVSALFFVSSCRHSSSPSTPQPAPAPTDTQDPPADTQKPGETPGTPGTTEPEKTSSETQEPSESTENQEPSETTENPDPENSSSETQETSETPETPTSPAANYTAENDESATTQPFTADICPLSGKTLSFSNGNWTVVDIWTSPQFAAKIISKITYDNTKENPYNCTSIIYKFDFPRQNLTENEVNFEAYFENIKNNSDLAAIKDILNFSHGYLTDTSIVIIAETPVEVFSLVYLSKLNTITNTATNLTQSKYYIIRGQYETIYIYKDSEELSAAESNAILQATQFEAQTDSLISQFIPEQLTAVTLTEADFNDDGYYNMQNTSLSLSEGNYTFIQKSVDALSNNSSQKCTTKFDFSLGSDSISFISDSGQSIYIVDLSFFESMLIEEAPDNVIDQYLALSSDEEKYEFLISSGGPLPENTQVIFDNGIILTIEELTSIPSKFIFSKTENGTTTYLFNLSNIIKENTEIKKNSNKFVFKTIKNEHGITETTITYLIKNN